MKDPVVMTYLLNYVNVIHIATSSLHKSKYCVMPDPFPVERFGKWSGYTRLDVGMAKHFSKYGNKG